MISSGSGKICNLKSENTSMTVLHVEHTDLSEIGKYIRQKKRQATTFFEACPLVIDFSKVDIDNLSLLDGVIDILKSEDLIFVGVKGIKSKFRDELLARRIPVYATSDVVPIQKKEDVIKIEKPVAKDIPKEQVLPKEKIELTKNLWDSIRGGQRVLAKDQNLMISGTVNEGAEVLSSGSIFVKGGLNGVAAAGVEGDFSATIVADKFNPTIISICGVYRLYEDGVPEDIKNKSVIVSLDENKHLKITKS
jgi:septum site-determining protein MinC